MRISVKNMERKRQIDRGKSGALRTEAEKNLTAKCEIRAMLRQRRDSLTAGEATEHSGAIQKNLAGWEIFQKAERICFYYPLGREVNLLSSAKEMLALGKQVYFPKTDGMEMDFYQVTNLWDFKEGNFHVMEPFFPGRQPEGLLASRKSGNLPVGCQMSSLLILVPGVAFDRKKRRMGYGKGYYDRYLAGLPGAIKAGIAYECQIVAHIPTEEQDISMDYMVTEAEIW